MHTLLLSILLLARGKSQSMTGAQLLIIYAFIGIVVGIVLASILTHYFTLRVRVALLAAGLIAIGLLYFIHPPSSLGIAYGYPFGVVMYYILNMGNMKK